MARKHKWPWKMGEGAAHSIRPALKGKISEEMRRRLLALRHKSEAISAAGLQQQRADHLRTLANGMPSARLTVEAQAALQRLQD